MPERADGLLWMPEARLADLCRVPRSTWQSWSREGLISVGHAGALDEVDAMTAVLGSALRDHFGLADAIKVWRDLEQSACAASFIRRALTLDDNDRFDLVLELETGRVSLATDDASLVQAVRHPESPRQVIVVSLAAEILRVRDGFRRLANRGRQPLEKRPGRPSRSAGNVQPLQRRG